MSGLCRPDQTGVPGLLGVLRRSELQADRSPGVCPLESVSGKVATAALPYGSRAIAVVVGDTVIALLRVPGLRLQAPGADEFEETAHDGCVLDFDRHSEQRLPDGGSVHVLPYHWHVEGIYG